jgi:hypothetical protein
MYLGHKLIILTEENGRIIKAALSAYQFVSESQSTEIHEDEKSAAVALLEYAAEGVEVARRDIEYARQIVNK